MAATPQFPDPSILTRGRPDKRGHTTGPEFTLVLRHNAAQWSESQANTHLGGTQFINILTCHGCFVGLSSKVFLILI